MNPSTKNEEEETGEDIQSPSPDESSALAIGRLEAPREVQGETAPPVAKKKRRRVSISLKVGLAATILMTVMVTSALIFFPWWFVSSKNIANIVEELNQEIIKGVAQEINNVFTNAESVLLTVDGIFSEDVVSLANEEQRKYLYLSLLNSNITFSWISFGWPNGDFMGAQRQNEETIRFISSKWSAADKKAKRDIAYFKVEGRKLKAEVTKVLENKYYAPQRGWFKRAVNNRGIVWTGVYVFATSKKPGINVAISHEKKGEFIGVITIAIELERISKYLKTINVGKTGTVFIMNQKRELIAFQDPKEVTHTLVGKEKPQLKKLGRAKDTRLLVANRALAENIPELSELASLRQISFSDPETGQDFFISVAPIEKRGWIVGTVIPQNDFLGEINKNMLTVLVVILFLILIAAIAVVLLSRYLIVNPLSKISNQTLEIQNFNLDQIEYTPSVIREVDQLSMAMDQMRRGLGSFQKYLPTELVRTLISQGMEARLGGEEKNLTVYFIDLVGFTKISEEMGPDLIPYLAHYMSEMSNLITGEKGTIDKYMGDAIMAFWGAPAPNEHHALNACHAALMSQKELNSLRVQWRREGKTPFQARIGINTGAVLVGNMGSEQRMDYTVIGDTVNVASRLEALNKMYGTQILIGEETFKEVQQEVIVRKLDTVVVYGREKGMDIYELLAVRDEVKLSDRFDWIESYEEGLAMFKSGNFGTAVKNFQKTLKLKEGGDSPSELLIKRCERYMRQSPDAKFKGVTVMRHK